MINVQALFAAALLACPLTAFSQVSFPDRPITMVVPFPAGGSVDVVARRVGLGLASALGQPVVIDNRAGAGGTIGAGYVARAPADGYTLMFATSSALAVSPALYKNISYDPIKSFASVIEVTRGPFILTVGNEVPVNNVPELLAYAKKNPGKLNYGSAGPGSAHHLAMESFKQVSHIDVMHVPYKGGAPAWVALMGGDVQMLFDSMPGPLLFPGKVKPIGVTGPVRLDKLPGVPTFAEQGIPGVDSVFFFGVVAPAGTPAEIVGKLNKALFQSLASTEVKEALEAQGLTATPGTPDDFAKLLAKEVPRYQTLVQKIGLTID